MKELLIFILVISFSFLIGLVLFNTLNASLSAKEYKLVVEKDIKVPTGKLNISYLIVKDGKTISNTDSIINLKVRTLIFKGQSFSTQVQNTSDSGCFSVKLFVDSILVEDQFNCEDYGIIGISK